MRLSGLCTLLEMRGKYLLLLPSADMRGQQALEVNQSFAFLWRTLEGKEFSPADVAAALQQEYGLDPEDAAREAGQVIALWEKRQLTEE